MSAATPVADKRLWPGLPWRYRFNAGCGRWYISTDDHATVTPEGVMACGDANESQRYATTWASRASAKRAFRRAFKYVDPASF